MSGITLIDAGYSTQLEKHINEKVNGHPLWTARFLVTNKEACINAHRDFIKAGSQIVRTNSYQASIDGFVKYMDMTSEKAFDVIKGSAELVKEAIRLENAAGHSGDVLVVGSIGPYGACQHDGSEYTGRYAPQVTPDFLKEWHRPRLEALISAGVKTFAFETFPCSYEALAVLELIKKYPEIRGWVSFTAKNELEISNGEKFSEAASSCWSTNPTQLMAVGLNCLKPELVAPLVKSLTTSSSKHPIIVYPNSGEDFDINKHDWVGVTSGKKVSDYVSQWLDLGVSYVGGCCRTDDRVVAAIAEEIRLWKAAKKV